MADQHELFRSLKRIPRRIIHISKGVLYASYIETAVVICKNRLRGLQKNVLYVPKLGINLVLVKKLYKEGLEEKVNQQGIYFSKDNIRVLKSKPDNGLYLITYIKYQFNEITLLVLGLVVGARD